MICNCRWQLELLKDAMDLSNLFFLFAHGLIIANSAVRPVVFGLRFKYLKITYLKLFKVFSSSPLIHTAG